MASSGKPSTAVKRESGESKQGGIMLLRFDIRLKGDRTFRVICERDEPLARGSCHLCGVESAHTTLRQTRFSDFRCSLDGVDFSNQTEMSVMAIQRIQQMLLAGQPYCQACEREHNQAMNDAAVSTKLMFTVVGDSEASPAA